ncbi:hypothetical protein V491_00564 [Pseudogymnoascus sp. VKM F-3775]|nr:hypothetical protein V491_00564 [Pseudogymnoascus sp. VKM F-3775]
MQLFRPLLVFLSLLGISSACVKLNGTMNQERDAFTGTLNYNGREVCVWKIGTELKSPSVFATCIPGFSAYITRDANTVGYSNNGYEVKFRTRVIANPPLYPGLPYVYPVTAENYGC